MKKSVTLNLEMHGRKTTFVLDAWVYQLLMAQINGEIPADVVNFLKPHLRFDSDLPLSTQALRVSVRAIARPSLVQRNPYENHS